MHMEISMFRALVVTVFFLAHGVFLWLVAPAAIKSIFKYNAKYALKNNVEVTITWREPFWLIIYFYILIIANSYIYFRYDIKPWVVYFLGILLILEAILLLIYVTYFCFFREDK
jgi:hypothetical protein